MRARIGAFDWSATPLGKVAAWPECLRVALALMLDSDAQIVMLAGPDMIALYNDAYARAIGTRHPGALGRPARDTWAELWPEFGPLLEAVRTTGRSVSFGDRPVRIERRGGSETVRFDVACSPVRDGDGGVHAVLCILSETTDRAQAQEALRQSEQRLRALFAQAAVGIAIGTPDGRLTMVNECFCQMTGYNAQELTGRRIEDLLHADDRDRAEAGLRRLAAEAIPFVAEECLRRKDGALIWIARSTGAVLDGDGRIAQISSVVTDVTERRRAEAHARRLAAIIASSDDAILCTDLDMRITSWNGGAERLYGYASEEAIGMPVTMLVPGDRAEEEPQIIARIRSGARVEPHETIRLHKDGHEVEVSLTASPILDEYGRIIGASKIARDITGRMAAERLQKLLVGEMKHRVKNILATVDAIARQTFRTSPTPGAEAFTARLQALSRAQDLVTRDSRDGAELSALVAGVTGPYPPGRFDLSGPKLLLSARAALTFTLGLHELATNAAKYGALAVPEGRVRIGWALNAGEFTLTWQEEGVGSLSPPGPKGFGTLLIEEVMAAEIGGRVALDFCPGGVVCTVTAPADESWLHEE